MPIDEIKVEHINQFKKVVSISYKKKRQIDQYEPLELGYFVSQELKVEEDHKPIAEQLYNDASSFVLDKLYPEDQKAEKSVESNVHGSSDKKAFSDSQASTDSRADTEPKEEVIMDLTDVVVVDETPKSYVVYKDGYSKLVPFSQIKSPTLPIKFQEKINIVLIDKAEKWFHTKPWQPFRPYKKGGG